VEVVLGGERVQRMIFDTGASYVTLPGSVAREMGMTPGEANRVINLRIADGSTVAGRLMTLSSVRVGPFESRDVPCVVLPEEMASAPALLGGSFLRDYTYEIDPGRGMLTLTRVELSGDGDDTR